LNQLVSLKAGLGLARALLGAERYRQAALVAVLAGLVACTSTEPRTQVMLVVDAEDSLREVADSLRVEVRGYFASEGAGADRTQHDEVYALEALSGSWPYSFAIAPQRGDSSRLYDATITLQSAGGGTLAVLRVSSGFVQGKTLAVALRFDSSCKAKSLECDASESCAAGSCVPAKINPRMLPELDGPESGGGAGRETDMSPVGTGGTVAVGGAGASGDAAGGGGAPRAGTGATPRAGSGGTTPPAAGTGGSEGPPGTCGDGQVTGTEQCDTAIATGQDGACPTACAPEPCGVVVLEGNDCDARCTLTPLEVPVPNDGCCAPGSTPELDSDCKATCGNGVLEGNETCDPPSNCPTPQTCTSDNACIAANVTGDAATCSAVCNLPEVVECRNGDRCCPDGCTRATDGDCSASCGDGVVTLTAFETCEPTNALFPCPTPETCKTDGCSKATLTGSAANCNSFCSRDTIDSPKRSDGCCPPNANANNDNDCRASCGNNVVEAGERCDGNCPGGANDCNDDMNCTADRFSGSGCNRRCEHTPITAPSMSADGCCPPGATSGNDPDCRAVCGNGVKDPGELCDGADCPTSCPADPDPCKNNQVVGTECQRRCMATTRTASTGAKDGCCPASANANTDSDCMAMCGNGMREMGEECDGSLPAGASCPPPGACLTTRPSCERCMVECVDAPLTPCCGNRTVESGETCDDGNTAAGDGCSASCTTEVPDPPPDPMPTDPVPMP
jgi:cysteine-rich repeat protein